MSPDTRAWRVGTAAGVTRPRIRVLWGNRRSRCVASRSRPVVYGRKNGCPDHCRRRGVCGSLGIGSSPVVHDDTAGPGGSHCDVRAELVAGATCTRCGRLLDRERGAGGISLSRSGPAFSGERGGAGFTALALQATTFAALHYQTGFPRGLVGVGLAFIYGFVLGAIRRHSGGLMAAVVIHCSPIWQLSRSSCCW